MTEAGWAEKAVDKRLSDGWSGDAWVMGPGEAAYMLRKEHARVIRIVQTEIKRVKLSQYKYSAHEKAYILVSLDRVLAALQRGRTGRGK